MKWKVKFTFVNEYKCQINDWKIQGISFHYSSTNTLVMALFVIPRKQDATIAGTSHSTDIYLYLIWLGFGLMWKLSKSEPKDVIIDYPHNDASNSVFFIETPGLGVNTNHCYKNRL